MEKMKTISEYTIYCTEDQTIKALELGAPIEVTKRLEPLVNRKYISDLQTYTAIIIPTAGQLIGWLEEQNILIEYTRFMGKYACRLLELHDNGERNLHIQKIGSSRKEATLAAIDAALKHLSNKIEKI